MSETANFNMKLPKSMKDEAQATFKSMGMDMATANRHYKLDQHERDTKEDAFRG